MLFHLAVFGCQMNANDADRVRTVLLEIGGQETESMEKADLIIYVTCSIRQHAEDRVFGFLHNMMQKRGKDNVVQAITGCMARKTSSRKQDDYDPLIRRSKALDIVFRITDTPRLPELLKAYFPQLTEFGGEFAGIFETIPTQKANHSAFVPISTGCDHHCTYCIVPHTRGKEFCRSREEIIDECKTMIARGAKEITLLGQNVNRYYFGERSPNPYRTDFAELLEEVAELPNLQWLRFLSPHPQHLGADVIEVMAKHPNICRHLHLPAQSGDNAMLQKMARGYTVEKFKETVRLARERIPGISVTTDIIVGFCGESEEQYQNSKALCEEVGFDKIFIGKFSVRPHTPAAKWEDDVPLEEKKRRYHELNEVLKKSSKASNLRDIGRTVEVLVDRVDEETGIAQGHTNESKIIDFTVGKRGAEFVGEIVDVKVTGARTFFLEGELVTKESTGAPAKKPDLVAA